MMSLAVLIAAIVAVFGYLVKHHLDQKAVRLATRREVYEEISISLGIFVKRRDDTDNLVTKKTFLDQYLRLRLWASDPVIRAANDFSDAMVAMAAQQSETDSATKQQMEAKHAYARFILAMRRDLGFSGTLLDAGEYRFTSFQGPGCVR